LCCDKVEVPDVYLGLKEYEKRDEREMREKCVNSWAENKKIENGKDDRL